MRKLLKKSLAILLAVLLMVPSFAGVFASADTAPVYKLTFIYTDVNGEKKTASTNLAAGAAVDISTMVPVGQEVKELFADEQLTQKADPVMPDHALTVYGKTEWINCTVTYMLNGSEYAKQTYRYGDPLVLPILTVEDGYAFSGWSDTDGNAYTNGSVILGDVKLFGTKRKIDYKLTYVVNGEIHRTQIAHYNDRIDDYKYPAATGYTFAGWFADADCTQAAPAMMPNSDLTVYGTYTQNVYTITYFVDGLEIGSKQEYTYGQTIAALDYNVEGYTFSGWYLDPALTQENTYETMPAQNLTFYGKRTPNKYVLTYYYNDEFYNAQTYEYNQPIAYLEYIPQAGYAFSGWLLKGDKGAPLTMPAHNVDVYGTQIKISQAKLDGGQYNSIAVGDSVEVVISLDAPYLTALTISDISFDEDIFMLDSMEWLVEGTKEEEIELGERFAGITFAENTDINGEVLCLTFVVLSNEIVGMHEIGFSTSAKTDIGVGDVDVPTSVTAAKVQIICAEHDFAGEKQDDVIANKNNTHSIRCANGCGVSINQSCSGGSATCLEKAVCSICKAGYGSKLAHKYKGSPKSNGNGTHSYRCVSGCGVYSTEQVNCTYGVALNNGDNTTHKISCTVCGESKDENCYGGTVTCLQVAVCDRCGVEYGEVLPHSYTGNVKNNYNGTHVALCVNGCNTYSDPLKCDFASANKNEGVHTNVCKVCNYTVDEYCTGGKATCIAPAKCKYCETPYGNKISHSYTGTALDNGDGTHSLQCVNGCELYGEKINCTPGTFVSVGDGTHTASCTVCQAALTGTCTGGTATCAEYAKCEFCGGDHGDLLAHDYSGALAPNGDGTHSKLCVNGCNKTGGETTACTFSETWVGDGIAEHIKTCAGCGDTIREACTGGTATCAEKSICTVCDTAYGELLPHTFTGAATNNENGTHIRHCSSCDQNVTVACEYGYTPNANGTHLAACSICLYNEVQDCFGGSATCQQKALCDGCKAAYGEMLKHDYSGSAKDNGDGTHYLQCVNGCEQFGGEKITCTPGTFVSNGDDTHSAPCVDCGATLTAKCYGGVASCELQAICEACGSGYGKGGDHNFGSAHDKTHHWGLCLGCGKTTPAEEHTFSDWTIITPATTQSTGLHRHYCIHCGAVFTEMIPRTFTMGDVDFDGVLAAGDARLILRASVGLETFSATAIACADVEKDGVITSGDARLILRATVGLDDSSALGIIGLDNDGNIVVIS